MVQGRPEFKEPRTVSAIIEKAELEILEQIGWRDHLARSEIVRKAVQEYNKNHGEGNSTFKLDQFQDPNFKAMPATFSSDDKWDEYIRNHMNEEELDELDKKSKFIAKTIEAKKWLNKRNAKISNSS